MRRRPATCPSRLLATIALGVLAGGPASAADAPSFHITAIGSYPGRAQAIGVNAGGDVALWGLSAATPPAHTLGATWSAGALIALPDLGGGDASPAAINDLGTVIGVSTASDGAYHPALWSGGGVTDLATALGPGASPMAINRHGVVAAWVEVPTPSGFTVPNAATWTNGVVSVLPTLTPGDPYASAHCYGINDGGTVVGDSGAHAVAWLGGVPTDLGDFGIADFGAATAFAINASGVIACWASDTARHESLWLWSHGTATALPPLATGYSQDYSLSRSTPRSINAGGDVVGEESFGSGGIVAVLWRGGQAFDLITCLASGEGAGWTTLISAAGINDQGDIVGYGLYNGQFCAFELTPVVAGSAGTSTAGGATGAAATGGPSGTATAGSGTAASGVAAGSAGAGGCGLGGSAGLVLLAVALQLLRSRRGRG